jgi:hypothetical protein
MDNLFGQMKALNKLKEFIEIQLDDINVKLMEEHKKLNPDPPKTEPVSNTTKDLIRELKVKKDIKIHTYELRDFINLKAWEYRQMIHGVRNWNLLTPEDTLENVFVFKINRNDYIEFQKSQGCNSILYPSKPEFFIVLLTRGIRHSTTKSTFYTQTAYYLEDFAKGSVNPCPYKPHFYIKLLETYN